MASERNSTYLVMSVVLQFPGHDVDAIVTKCRGLTWNQVFLELDQLSREGSIVLKREANGQYTVAPSETVSALTY